MEVVVVVVLVLLQRPGLVRAVGFGSGAGALGSRLGCVDVQIRNVGVDSGDLVGC